MQVDDFLQQLNQFFLQFLLYLSLAYNVLPIWGIFLIGVAILLPFGGHEHGFLLQCAELLIALQFGRLPS